MSRALSSKHAHQGPPSLAFPQQLTVGRRCLVAVVDHQRTLIVLLLASITKARRTRGWLRLSNSVGATCGL